MTRSAVSLSSPVQEGVSSVMHSEMASVPPCVSCRIRAFLASIVPPLLEKAERSGILTRLTRRLNPSSASSARFNV